MLHESQLNINSTETKLLYDIRSESQKTNELLSQLLKALRPMRKDTAPKRGKTKVTKEAVSNGTLPKSNRGISNSDSGRHGAGHSGKRQAVHDMQHGGTATLLQPSDDSNGGERIPRSSGNNISSEVLSKG